jgi:hypothetical protein
VVIGKCGTPQKEGTKNQVSIETCRSVGFQACGDKRNAFPQPAFAKNG